MPTVPAPVSVEVATFQTAAGIEVIDDAIDESDEPSDVEAVRTALLVFALTTAASDVEAVVTVAFTLDVALLISLLVASEPVVRPAPVRVRVVADQTSVASVPNDESVRELYAHTFAGIDVMSEPIDVEAVRTALFVFALTDEVIPEVTLLVFALTTAATDVVAIASAESVFAFTLAVPAVTAAPSDVEAVVTSDCVASEPLERPAPVRVLVPFVHTSAARVPNVVSERVPAAQTFAGIEVMDEAIEVSEKPSDVEAVRTALFVFALTTAASDVEAVVTVVFTLDVALLISLLVASEPVVRPAPVSVRVA